MPVPLACAAPAPPATLECCASTSPDTAASARWSTSTGTNGSRSSTRAASPCWCRTGPPAVSRVISTNSFRAQPHDHKAAGARARGKLRHARRQENGRVHAPEPRRRPARERRQKRRAPRQGNRRARRQRENPHPAAPPHPPPEVRAEENRRGGLRGRADRRHPPAEKLQAHGVQGRDRPRRAIQVLEKYGPSPAGGGAPPPMF
jgi:hypothetical protein